MFAKITDGFVAEFPFSAAQLRAENPNTSFPKEISTETLKSWGVEVVTSDDLPSVAAGEVIERDAQPSLVDGEWRLGFTVRSANAQEIDFKASSVREERDRLLSECDWTQVSDSPLGSSSKSDWAAYRQALRDVTSQEGFPFDVTWPAKP